MRELHDHFFRLAKREGYRSRAAYKLIEIDDKKQVLRPGDRVLDCGAAPGAWTQVTLARVGPRGFVVAVDLKEIAAFSHGARVQLVRGDLAVVDTATLGPPFDVVLSDMAPSTTGDHTIDHHQSMRLVQVALETCDAALRKGGHFVCKVFEGEAYPELLATLRNGFESVKGFSPKASRDVSREIFVVAKGFRGFREFRGLPGDDDASGQTDAETSLPRRKPSSGWS